jgi:hypothetical protein
MTKRAETKEERARTIKFLARQYYTTKKRKLEEKEQLGVFHLADVGKNLSELTGLNFS